MDSATFVWIAYLSSTDGAVSAQSDGKDDEANLVFWRFVSFLFVILPLTNAWCWHELPVTNCPKVRVVFNLLTTLLGFSIIFHLRERFGGWNTGILGGGEKVSLTLSTPQWGHSLSKSRWKTQLRARRVHSRDGSFKSPKALSRMKRSPCLGATA